MHPFLLAPYIWKSKKCFFNSEKKITMIFRYIFLGAGVGAGVVWVHHKNLSAGAVRVKNDGSLCSLPKTVGVQGTIASNFIRIKFRIYC